VGRCCRAGKLQCTVAVMKQRESQRGVREQRESQHGVSNSTG